MEYEYREPRYQVDTPSVKECIAKARDYYALRDENCSGGFLHIVLDDGNTEAQHVAFCLNLCVENWDREGYELALDLLMLSESERMEVYEGRRKRPWMA